MAIGGTVVGTSSTSSGGCQCNINSNCTACSVCWKEPQSYSDSCGTCTECDSLSATEKEFRFWSVCGRAACRYRPVVMIITSTTTTSNSSTTSSYTNTSYSSTSTSQTVTSTSNTSTSTATNSTIFDPNSCVNRNTTDCVFTVDEWSSIECASVSGRAGPAGVRGRKVRYNQTNLVQGRCGGAVCATPHNEYQACAVNCTYTWTAWAACDAATATQSRHAVVSQHPSL